MGLMIASGGGAWDAWFESQEHCDATFIEGQWWRIPLYLLCCLAVLGQFRVPICHYWRGLVVQLVAYEVQYQVGNAINEDTYDNLDKALSNVAAAMCGVICACAMSWVLDACRKYYCARILKGEENMDYSSSKFGDFIYWCLRCRVKADSLLRIGRESDVMKFQLKKLLKDQRRELDDPHHPRDCIVLPEKDEHLFLETVVGAQGINVWSLLMPALYQLVPGSLIAEVWFHYIFPNPDEDLRSSAYSDLWVVSTSLALGLIFGFTIMQCCTSFFGRLKYKIKGEDTERIKMRKRSQAMFEGMYTAGKDPGDDPDSIHVPSETDHHALELIPSSPSTDPCSLCHSPRM